MSATRRDFLQAAAAGIMAVGGAAVRRSAAAQVAADSAEIRTSK